MKDFLIRLTSRKLLLAAGAFLIFIANKQYTEALTVILTYIGINGAAEVASTIKTSTNTTTPIPFDTAPLNEDILAINTTGKIVSGRTIDEHADDPDWQN